MIPLNYCKKRMETQKDVTIRSREKEINNTKLMHLE